MPKLPLKKTDKPCILLTVKDVAVADNCSEKSVRRAIAAGLLEVVRVGPTGRMVRITPAAHAIYRQAARW